MTVQTFQYSNFDAEKSLSIVVQGVDVTYETRSSSPDQFKQATLRQRTIGKLLGRDPNIYVNAVKDANFMAFKGDSIGFLGINGAGKSSLLRIVGGMESPARGRVYASAQPQLLGVSAALMPELSGYENARLGCLALGMTPDQVEEALPEIIDFTAIGDAIYRPMRSYSSGMGARLRFAISTAAEPEILIIDEALSTGDATFQERSKMRMDTMLENTGTILLVSHSAPQVRMMCTRAIWMHHGRIIADGLVDEITDYYTVWAGLLRKDSEGADKYLREVEESYQPISIKVYGTDELRRVTSSEL